MPYEATCPKGHRLQVTKAHFGERVNCPTCGEPFVVPDPAAKLQPSTTPPYAAVKGGADSRRWKPSMESVAGLSQAAVVAGRPMVALGLILVLLARGCDGISHRGVERAEAKVRAAKQQFDNGWQTQRVNLQQKITTLEETKEPKAKDQEALTDLKQQLRDLGDKETKARQRRRRASGVPWRSPPTTPHSTTVSMVTGGRSFLSSPRWCWRRGC